MPMTTVPCIHQPPHLHPATTSLPVSTVRPSAAAQSREEKPKKIKSVVCVGTERSDTTLTQFRASPVKLSFDAMLSKEW